jgi:hypothetical protein
MGVTPWRVRRWRGVTPIGLMGVAVLAPELHILLQGCAEGYLVDYQETTYA